MPLTEFTRKSLAVLLAGSTIYYLVSDSFVDDRTKHSPVEKRLHAETDTTPVPTPNDDQPGNMENDQLTSS